MTTNYVLVKSFPLLARDFWILGTNSIPEFLLPEVSFALICLEDLDGICVATGLCILTRTIAMFMLSLSRFKVWHPSDLVLL